MLARVYVPRLGGAFTDLTVDPKPAPAEADLGDSATRRTSAVTP